VLVARAGAKRAALHRDRPEHLRAIAQAVLPDDLRALHVAAAVADRDRAGGLDADAAVAKLVMAADRQLSAIGEQQRLWVEAVVVADPNRAAVARFDHHAGVEQVALAQLRLGADQRRKWVEDDVAALAEPHQLGEGHETLIGALAIDLLHQVGEHLWGQHT